MVRSGTIRRQNSKKTRMIELAIRLAFSSQHVPGTDGSQDFRIGLQVKVPNRVPLTQRKMARQIRDQQM